eukprot:6371-Heterococcus_DN1.PRE.1
MQGCCAAPAHTRYTKHIIFERAQGRYVVTARFRHNTTAQMRLNAGAVMILALTSAPGSSADVLLAAAVDGVAEGTNLCISEARP